MALLKQVKIIDLSHRLPGPLCGKILSDLGAEVIKIEDDKFRDPFLNGLFAQIDISFINWYHNLNDKKQVRRFDFNSKKDQEVIRSLVSDADAIILGIPEKTCTKLGLTSEFFYSSKPKVIIEMQSSRKNSKSMHDLNALADSGLLKMHIDQNKNEKIDPPFLPIAGITFGHKAATDLLAALLLVEKTKETQFITTYLDESTRDILGIFWPASDRENDRLKFLHNGLFPCYNIYKTKDQKFIALAAVEEKFWIRFCELFEIKTNLDRFFCKDERLFKLIAEKISHYDLKDIELLIQNEDVCITSVT